MLTVAKSVSKPYEDTGHLGSARFWLDGSLIKVAHPKADIAPKGGGLRGVVHGFSRAARRRLMQMLAQVRQDSKPLFVTLTYPNEFPLDSREWKYHFKKWCMRLHRKYPKAGFIWRLEPQRRGAPHYHVLLYGVVLDLGFREWLRSSWFQCVDSGDEKHLRHGTDVRLCTNAKHVRSYIGKYLAKVQAPFMQANEDGELLPTVDWVHVGRWWGVRYSENLPFSKVVGGRSLEKHQVYRLMRYLRRYLKGQGVRVNAQMPSMTVFVNNPVQWYANSYELMNC